jgi:hypothetical protein
LSSAIYDEGKALSAVVPSYLAKVSRAEKHLIELHEAIEEYAARKPYTVRQGVEGKMQKTIHRLVFTSDPGNTDIPIIAADVIYNLRSGLDHLMSCLVANKERSGVIFPIFFQGVWEDPLPGENAERGKLRARWASDTKSLKAPALTILKGLQPPEDTGDDTEADRLRVLNSLSNRDRHEKLPVTVSGLGDFAISLKRADGKVYKALPDLVVDFAKNDAPIQIPEDSVDVKIDGTPLVVIRVGRDKAGRDRYLRLPTFLGEAIPFLKTRVVNPLIPHVRR